MVLRKLPKITRIAGGAETLNTADFALDNYRVLTFLIENGAGNELTVTVKAKKSEEGTAVAVPFRFKAVDDADYAGVTKDGKTVNTEGAFFVTVTADGLSRDEYDRAALCLSSGTANITTVYAVQSQPRYTE
jgi:hypothetical protein